MSEKAHINPQVLRWARETAKITLEQVAQHMKKTVHQIIAWEEGTDHPTIKQAETLAHYYRRPFAAMFLPRIPSDFQVLRDFRSNARGEFSTGLVFMMREVQEKQLWARAAFEEAGDPQLTFVGRFDRRVSAETVASDIRRTLAIETKAIGENPLKYWIQRAEAARIFVSLSSNFHTRMKLDSDEVKGLAIADPFAPFVFLNTDDWENSQLFTLVHELSHIWINQSGVSVDVCIDFREGQPTNIDPVELYCNEVAANALMPSGEIKERIRAGIASFSQVDALARQFRVSSLAMLYRLGNLSIISRRQLASFRKESDRQFQQYVAKQEAAAQRRPGSPDYYILQLRRNGRAFSQLVMDYYRGGHISGTEASRLLRVKLNNFPSLEKHLYR
jgi:Zn-dependent peptidase ImmA (M78 family)